MAGGSERGPTPAWQDLLGCLDGRVARRDEVLEYLAHAEWGLALDLLCYLVAEEDEVQLTAEELQLFAVVAEELGMREEWVDLLCWNLSDAELRRLPGALVGQARRCVADQLGAPGLTVGRMRFLEELQARLASP